MPNMDITISDETLEENLEIIESISDPKIKKGVKHILYYLTIKQLKNINLKITKLIQWFKNSKRSCRMIKIFDNGFDISKVLNREIQTYGEYENVVKEVVANVICNGDNALKQYTQKFDGVWLDDLLVSQNEIEEAKAQGAIGLFGDKYGEIVKVYSMGDFSKEICGGPHAENTKDLGKFRIAKEQSSSAGVRRIKAVLE